MSDTDRIVALEAQVAKLEKAHAKFSHWDNCRRGADGGRGIQGERGATGSTGATGAPGNDGKDANIDECVAAAKQALRDELAATVSGAVSAALRSAKVIDDSGNSHPSLKGERGERGADSTVVGPQGERGERGADSVVPGPKGDPSTVPGPKGDKGDPSIVPGPAGKDGVSNTPGPVGPAGKDGAEVDTRALMIQIENACRNIWKNDILAAIRGHISSSHTN